MISLKSSIRTLVLFSRLYAGSNTAEVLVKNGRGVIVKSATAYTIIDNVDLSGTKYVQVGYDEHAYFFEATTLDRNELITVDNKRGEVFVAMLKAS